MASSKKIDKANSLGQRLCKGFEFKEKIVEKGKKNIA
jgi:hypothetical protein